jgi:hypothetical protein
MMALASGGREIYQYIQFDSYPSGWPSELLEYVRKRMAADPEQFISQIRNVRVLSDDLAGVTEEEKAALAKYADTAVSSHSLEEAYVLVRQCQGDLDLVLESGFILHQQDWPLDSLFCEYGYLIDADKMTFEVYKGFQTEPHRQGRFGPRKTEPTPGEIAERARMAAEYPGYTPSLYFPIRLKGEWALTDLPTQEQMARAVYAGEDGHDEDGNVLEDEG